MILAGDIGGTKCNLALFDKKEGAFAILFQRRYPSHDYKKFPDLLAAFLDDARETLTAKDVSNIRAAGFGVAGPVVGYAAHLTNLGWDLDGSAIERQLGTAHVALLNDLESTGYSLPWLAAGETCPLNSGTPIPRAAQALIAAGTGLGEALLHWNSSRYVVVPGEGGHCDLAPRNEKEIELLRYMKKTHPCVSFELILSGRGFYTIHHFLNPGVRHESFDQPGIDPAPEISRRGLEGSCPVCVETLDIWSALYGAEAGNLALKALARGGVFVAGGIAVKLLPKMKDGTFLRAFCEKEKFQDLLSEVPIKIVLNEQAPLIGAAAEAALLLDA
jgi:glucokinase